MDITSLKNKYFILRHGESEANVARILTSNPAICTDKYGLTVRGRAQVTKSIVSAKQRGWLDSSTLIYCSDFKRTVETAELARNILQTGVITPNPVLRERFFGNYDGKSTDKYIELWTDSEEEINNQKFNNVETSDEILKRLEKFVDSLESKHAGNRILLVSHGDPLQVLQAAFAGLNTKQRRELKYIQPGEIRALRPK